MAKKLTDAFVRNLRKPTIVFDTQATGLGIKRTPGGKTVWVMQTIFPGHQHQTKRNLGEYDGKEPGLTVASAREKAKRWRAWVKAGDDPQVEEERERREKDAQRKDTFESFAEQYLGEKTNRRAAKDAYEIRKYLVPEWGRRPITEIEPSDVRDLIDKIKRRSPYVAAGLWTHVGGLFKMAVHDGRIKISPCASLNKKLLFKGAGLRHRDRYLNDAELFAFWRATGRLSYPAREAARLLLLTGVRSSEVRKAAWTELNPELRKIIRDALAKKQTIDWTAVDDAVKFWTVPAERFKADAENIVALPDDACAILATLPRQAGCDFLFSNDGKTALWLGNKIKRDINARMLRTLRAQARMSGEDPASVKLPNWTFHDLRRTVRTNLSALKVEDVIAEMILGHGRKGIQRVYDMHKFLPEMRAAREAWARRLRTIVELAPAAPPSKPTNVVLLEARR